MGLVIAFGLMIDDLMIKMYIIPGEATVPEEPGGYAFLELLFDDDFSCLAQHLLFALNISWFDVSSPSRNLKLDARHVSLNFHAIRGACLRFNFVPTVQCQQCHGQSSFCLQMLHDPRSTRRRVLLSTLFI